MSRSAGEVVILCAREADQKGVAFECGLTVVFRRGAEAKPNASRVRAVLAHPYL